MAITDTDGVSTNLLGHVGCGEKLEAADGGVETQADGSGICLIDLRVLLDHLRNHHTPSQGGRREWTDQLERERAEGEEQKGAHATRIAQVVRREGTETGKERNNSRLLHGPRSVRRLEDPLVQQLVDRSVHPLERFGAGIVSIICRRHIWQGMLH